jgi:hypothetical protein
VRDAKGVRSVRVWAWACKRADEGQGHQRLYAALQTLKNDHGRHERACYTVKCRNVSKTSRKLAYGLAKNLLLKMIFSVLHAMSGTALRLQSTTKLSIRSTIVQTRVRVIEMCIVHLSLMRRLSLFDPSGASATQAARPHRLKRVDEMSEH